MSEVLLTDEIKEKISFVRSIGNAIGKYRVCVESLDYDVFFDKDGMRREYLVVTYKGGAIAARNCRGNSLFAIFEEITHLFNGGYYDEVSTYQNLKAGR